MRYRFRDFLSDSRVQGWPSQARSHVIRVVSFFLVMTIGMWTSGASPVVAKGSENHNKQLQTQSSVAAKTPPRTAGDLIAAADAYTLGPEDVLEVSVWKNPELTQEETVRPDGKIALKLVGEVPVDGMTIPQLRKVLAEKYRDFVPEAEVSVTLKEMNKFKVYVLGRVNKPGEYKVKSSLSVLQALSLAGGFTPYANDKKIKVFRTRDGKEQILSFNYRKVLEGKAGDMELQPGDRLVIP